MASTTRKPAESMNTPAPLARFLHPDQLLSPADLQDLILDGEVLEKTKRTGAPKVILSSSTGDTSVITKLWHTEWAPSSNWLRPYATRFRYNAARLRSLGVSAPPVRGWGKISRERIRFVSYDLLAGTPLRKLAPCIDLESTGAYVAGLHELGVDFRSMHLGNILWDANIGYSLIDVTDCTFGRRFSLKRRTARLGYFCWHKKDRGYLQQDENWIRFIRGYCQACGIDPEPIVRSITEIPTYRQLDRTPGER